MNTQFILAIVLGAVLIIGATAAGIIADKKRVKHESENQEKGKL